MKKIHYVSRAGLPIDAAGVRTLYIGDLLERAGYGLHYLADRRVGKNEQNSGYGQIPAMGMLLADEVHFCVGEKFYEVGGFVMSRIKNCKPDQEKKQFTDCS